MLATKERLEDYAGEERLRDRVPANGFLEERMGMRMAELPRPPSHNTFDPEEVHARQRELGEQERLSWEEADTIQEPLHAPGPTQACSNYREDPPGPAFKEEVHARLREPVEQEGLSREEADTILACFTKTGTHLVNSKAKTHLDNPEADTILACFTKTGTHLVNSKAETHLEIQEVDTVQEPPHVPGPD